jgi:hypothetical protein
MKCGAKSNSAWVSMRLIFMDYTRQSMGPGVANECIETEDGPDHLGGPFLPRDYRSGNWCGFARWETGELVFTSLTKAKKAFQSSAIEPAISHASCGRRHAADAKNYWPF